MEPKFSYREIARLTFGGGYSQREIASAAGCSPASVANIQRRIKATGIDAPAALEMGEQELRGPLSRDRGSKPSEKYAQPDFAAVQRQLDLHKGLTLTILWEEYAKRCSDAGGQAYLYSYFVEKCNRWASVPDIALRAQHVPGTRWRQAARRRRELAPYEG